MAPHIPTTTPRSPIRRFSIGDALNLGAAWGSFYTPQVEDQGKVSFEELVGVLEVSTGPGMGAEV